MGVANAENEVGALLYEGLLKGYLRLQRPACECLAVAAPLALEPKRQ